MQAAERSDRSARKSATGAFRVVGVRPVHAVTAFMLRDSGFCVDATLLMLPSFFLSHNELTITERDFGCLC